MSDFDQRELLHVAEDAARVAAAELMARFGERASGVRSKSTPTDLVSEADVAAEAAIRRLLGERRPRDAILGEEGGASDGDGDLRWVVDPLDGTVNFLFGIPAFAVSVACEDSAGSLVGVILDPTRDELFTAVRGGGAKLGGAPIMASSGGDLAMSLVATGFGYDADVRARQSEVLERLLPRVRDIRRVGAAALDLAWTACGRFDAYYERGIQHWDIAAGTLIATEAGLQVRGLAAAPGAPAGIVAAPAAVMDELFALVDGGSEF